MINLLFLCLLFSGSGQENPDHVVVISIDGLRPEFYRGKNYEVPTLKGWVGKGAHAVAVEGVFPSLTYPSHGSIVTGVRPARHGIGSNNKFGLLGGTREWYWEASDFRVPTLWQAARKSGDSVAIIYWPSSVGAKVRWRVPERWPVFKGESAPQLLLKLSTPGLLPELALALGLPTSKELEKKEVIDRFIAGSAAYVLKKYRPNLLFVHLIQVDGAQHRHGREDEAVTEALRRTDRNLKRIQDAAKEAGILERTCFVVVGDHGFLDVEWNLSPNSLLAEAGLIRLKKGRVHSWDAIGHAYGGSMGIHARDDESARKARKILEGAMESDGKSLWRIVDRKELDRLGADPDIAFALDAAKGYGFISSSLVPLVRARKRKGGLHGYLPTRPEMATGFVISGPGIRKTTIRRMHLIDIAPTLSHLMGWELKGVEGRVLPVIKSD